MADTRSIMTADTHVVLVRRFADGSSIESRWEGVGFAASENAASSLAHRPVDAHGRRMKMTWGDLLIAVPMESVNPLTMHRHVAAVYVVRKMGGIDRARRPPGWESGETWLSLWESADARPVGMLESVPKIESSRRAMALCACLRLVPAITGNAVHMQTIEVAEGWCRGSVRHDSLLRAASDSAGQVLGHSFGSAASDAALACYHLAQSITTKADERESLNHVRNALLRAELAAGPTASIAAEMADAVRAFVPLPVAILSLFGEHYPFSPGRKSVRRR